MRSLDGESANRVVIRYIGHKVPILDVEAYVSKLPYIAEACVLSVPSPNNRLTEQRVGILVRVKVSNEGRGESLCHQHDLTLERLREDLSHDLPLSMLPTIMHVLRDGEEIPKTLSDKVRRKDAVSKFFPVSGLELSPRVGKWDAEAYVV
jgi:malonyl-CoA/methylmalonyl-CoA synthetase